MPTGAWSPRNRGSNRSTRGAARPLSCTRRPDSTRRPARAGEPAPLRFLCVGRLVPDEPFEEMIRAGSPGTRLQLLRHRRCRASARTADLGSAERDLHRVLAERGVPAGPARRRRGHDADDRAEFHHARSLRGRLRAPASHRDGLATRPRDVSLCRSRSQRLRFNRRGHSPGPGRDRCIDRRDRRGARRSSLLAGRCRSRSSAGCCTSPFTRAMVREKPREKVRTRGADSRPVLVVNCAKPAGSGSGAHGWGQQHLGGDHRELRDTVSPAPEQPSWASAP